MASSTRSNKNKNVLPPLADHPDINSNMFAADRDLSHLSSRASFLLIDDGQNG